MTQSDGSLLGSVILFGALALIFYFMVLRPQRRRVAEQQSLAAALEVGDEVRTFGGLYGVVTAVDDKAVTLRLVEGKARIDRRAIAERVGGGE